MKVKDIVEIALLYVGVPAITLYPLGFVALGLQMWKDPFFPYYEFEPIWDAVSLVPRTVVVGTGVELLYLSAISTLLGVGIASVTFHSLRSHSRNAAEEGDGRRGLWSLYLLVLLPLAALLAYNSITLDGWNDLPYMLGFLVFSAGGGVLVGYIRGRNHDRFFMLGLAVAYAGSILAALCIAPIDVPNLPVIQTNARVGTMGDCSVLPDRTFVKLSEGETHWQVYNETGLYSLPYEELRYVRYYQERCPGIRDPQG